MRKLVFVALLGLLSAVSTSCGSTYQIELETEPGSAQIFINGEYVSETPHTVEVSFSEWERVYVHLLRRGYVPALVTYTEDTLPDELHDVIELRLDR